MKHIIFLISVFFCCAQVVSQENENSLLWEISGKKTKSTSYLFGTIHLIDENRFIFPDNLGDNLAKTELLILEIGSISEQMASQDVSMLLLENGASLFNQLNNSQLDSLFSFFNEVFEMNQSQVEIQFSQLKPIVVAQFILQSYFGANPKSYELILEQLAKENKIDIIGLETVNEQLQILTEIDLNLQVQILMNSIDKTANTEELDELITLYYQQQIDSLSQISIDYKLHNNSLEQELLIKRNKKWIPKLKNHLKKNSCFIAVGAAHLGGPNGLIRLLINEGYQLTPINLEINEK